MDYAASVPRQFEAFQIRCFVRDPEKLQARYTHPRSCTLRGPLHGPREPLHGPREAARYTDRYTDPENRYTDPEKLHRVSRVA